ncbi:MAG TPA: cation transporter [Methylomirabilota bacterium]
MKDCCAAPAAVPAHQRRLLLLLLVLSINAAMFLIECGVGLAVHSTSLLADSVDMLGDALVYGVSLYVIRRGAEWQARAALLKGGVMAAFGAVVLAEVSAKLLGHVVPPAPVMGGVGLLALTANLLCLALLWPRRLDDVNMRSAWLCSRNDVLANGGVLLAAAGVWVTGSAWPDIAIGLLIAALFVSSAITVIRGARRARRILGPASSRRVTPRATPQA